MRVLITGATGFIGKHLVPHLLGLGHEVEGWARSGGNRSVDLLSQTPLPLGRWDVVFHLAGHTRPNLDWDRDRVLENLAMTARVADHVAICSPGARFVLLSSGHIYAPADGPLSEADPIQPRGPYGLSKQLSESWAQSHTKDLNVIIVRAFNQLGPGMPPGLLLPDLITRIQEAKGKLRMRGRDAIRDFLDVRDAVEAYGRLCEASLPSGAVFNLCSGEQTRVSELISEVQKSLGIFRAVTFEDTTSDTLIGSRAKLSEALGWTPRYALADTIRFALRETLRTDKI